MFLFVFLFHSQLERELVEEWLLISGDETKKEEMENLIVRIETAVSFNMQNNAEIQACDLLMDIDRLDLIDKHLDSSNSFRVCHYLIRYRVFVYTFCWFHLYIYL